MIIIKLDKYYNTANRGKFSNIIGNYCGGLAKKIFYYNVNHSFIFEKYLLIPLAASAMMFAVFAYYLKSTIRHREWILFTIKRNVN